MRSPSQAEKAATTTFRLVFATVVAVAGCTSQQAKNDCIAELKRNGAEVQFGVASEEYYVAFPNRAFDDKALMAMMPYLKPLEPLASLDFSNTQISDASLDTLSRCRIKALHIKRTKISDKGTAELKRRLPHAWINHEAIKQQ